MPTITDLIDEHKTRSKRRENAPNNYHYDLRQPDYVKIEWLQTDANKYFKPFHLADEFGITNTRAGKFLARLERMGLVTQWGGRRSAYYLTDKGKSVNPMEVVNEAPA